MFKEKKISDIPFMEILKHSFRIAWKNKFLWWFGLFIALGTPGSLNMNFPSGGNSSKDITNESLENFLQSAKDFLHQYLVWIIFAGVVAFLIFLAIYVLGKISRGALIKSLEKILQEKPAGFKLGFSEGKKYFWKILGLDLLIGIFLFCIVLAVVAPSIILFAVKAYIAGALLLFPAIIIIIVLAILASYIKNYGHLYIVLANLPIWHSIESAYALFRKNIWTSILMSLINFAVSIIVGLPFVVLLFVFVLMGILGGLLVYALLQWTGVIIFSTIALLIFLAIIFLFRSIMEVFFQNVWILFFLEIATQPKLEAVAAEPVLETKIETKPSESVNMTKN